MKSIITTYPDFQALPRGVKIMLLFSENHFFSEVKSRPPGLKPTPQAGGLTFTDPDPDKLTRRVQQPFQ